MPLNDAHFGGSFFFWVGRADQSQSAVRFATIAAFHHHRRSLTQGCWIEMNSQTMEIALLPQGSSVL